MGLVEWERGDLDKLQAAVDAAAGLGTGYLDQEKKGFITEETNEALLTSASSAFPDVPREQLQALVVDFRFRHFLDHHFENWFPSRQNERLSEYGAYLTECSRQRKSRSYHGYAEWTEKQAWAVIDRAKQIDRAFWDTYCWRMNNIGFPGQDIEHLLLLQPKELFSFPQDLNQEWIIGAVQIFSDQKEDFTMLRPEKQELQSALNSDYVYHRVHDCSFVEWCNQSDLVKSLNLTGVR